MADGVGIQFAMTLFGVLLSIIAGLMTWQALAIIKAGKNIVVLETLLKAISLDLQKIAGHETMIAVLNSEVGNLKADTSLLFEKLRELERHEKPSIHRRQ